MHPGTRANAAVPSRLTRRVAEEIAALEAKATANGVDPVEAVRRMARDEYADWIEYDPKAPKFCDDLDSVAVTEMLSAGLVLGAPPQRSPQPGVDDEVKTEDQAPTRSLTRAPEGASGRFGGDGDQGLHEGRVREGVAESPRDRAVSGGDDPGRQGVVAVAGDVHSVSSTEEVAEMAQLVDDGREDPDDLVDKQPTNPASNANADASPASAGDGAPISRMQSEPGWTFLPQ